jgi:hypothetical protein
MKADERIARMRKQRTETTNQGAALVEQLTHDTTTEDFAALATALEERKKKTFRGENEGYVKMTIYVQQDLAKSFYALLTRHGDQKRFVNQALADFVKKKAREMGM